MKYTPDPFRQSSRMRSPTECLVDCSVVYNVLAWFQRLRVPSRDSGMPE